MIYYIYGNNELLGFKYADNKYYYHKNIFDDVVDIYDENNIEIVKYEYDSWGNIINIVDTSNINISIVNPFRYRSYYYDTDTNLYYLNSRYYSPVLKRFINCDNNLGSSEIIRSNNLFLYAYNNPVTFVDDSGSWPKWLKKAVKATAVVAVVATVASVSVATGGLAAPLVGAATGAVSGLISGVNSKGNLYNDVNNYIVASKKIRNEINKMRTNTKYALKVLVREATTKKKITQRVSYNAVTDIVSGFAGFAYSNLPDVVNNIIKWLKK